ncbi:aldo/keto reductase [Bacteriovorax sp. Seq25_V]|uniref:aldo/keto reductase n=1 Tax=Bacteriovorax sp. Seq25_V TaxID=1201288 RepID=UPI000389EEE7|nr:aldo/keto reductase [Bacteriovorax sp. Seq25_V]EQC45513.1 oxidoreductase, aldo/keto reductase family protein [Bacteriovorax sp. Seq25_V]
MKTKNLNNNKTIPMIGLGTWLSKPNEVYNIVKEAIKIGYRHIDCATVYGNEDEIGRALKEVMDEGIVKREDLFITSKLWNNSHARVDVVPELERSLKDLQLDYLDLYLMHWPVAIKKEVGFPQKTEDYISLEELPILETYKGMEDAYKKGLTKSLGVSNFSIKKLDQLINEAEVKPVMNQVELHPYLAQNKLVNYCNKNGIALTCYCPLGSAGRPAEMLASDEPLLIEDATIVELAKKYQKTPAQIILNWSILRGTIVIPKTVTPARAKENLESQDFELVSSDLKIIDQLDRNYRYVNGRFFTPEGGPYTYENLWDEA